MPLLSLATGNTRAAKRIGCGHHPAGAFGINDRSVDRDRPGAVTIRAICLLRRQGMFEPLAGVLDVFFALIDADVLASKHRR